MHYHNLNPPKHSQINLAIHTNLPFHFSINPFQTQLCHAILSSIKPSTSIQLPLYTVYNRLIVYYILYIFVCYILYTLVYATICTPFHQPALPYTRFTTKIPPIPLHDLHNPNKQFTCLFTSYLHILTSIHTYLRTYIHTNTLFPQP